jgi:hypothetical protein
MDWQFNKVDVQNLMLYGYNSHHIITTLHGCKNTVLQIVRAVAVAPKLAGVGACIGAVCIVHCLMFLMLLLLVVGVAVLGHDVHGHIVHLLLCQCAPRCIAAWSHWCSGTCSIASVWLYALLQLQIGILVMFGNQFN